MESESWCQKLQRSNKIRSGKDPPGLATKATGYQQEQFQEVLKVEARLQWAEEGMGREEVEVVSLSSGGKAIGWQPDGEGIRSWCRGCEERRRTLEHREGLGSGEKHYSWVKGSSLALRWKEGGCGRGLHD